MLLLAFDTAGPDCAVALVRSEAGGAEIVARRSERIGRGHAERLIPMIDEALGEAGAGYADLGKIAVTTGPGSFTGVRVGIAAARALALALDIAAIGIGSLQALAVAAGRQRTSGTVVAVLDAKRDEVYLYAQEIASGLALALPSAMPVDAAAALVRSFPEPIVLTGSAAPLLHDALGPRDAIVFRTAESPDIADVALLGLGARASGPPVPLYLRGADARTQAAKTVALL